ncbi:ISAzo13 family transposase [Streptomyces hirsutus]|nr:ISAzo13 family transposase [Streptomyces hirsutus]
MRVSESIRDQLAVKFEVLFPHLDERRRRLLMGAEARILGHGGNRAVARAAEASETTVRNRVDELEAGAEPLGRVRHPGGGRKRAAEVGPGLRPALLALVEPDMRGDPMSPLRWTTKSTRKLAAELTRQGHHVCADTVGDLLREEGFSLQADRQDARGHAVPGPRRAVPLHQRTSPRPPGRRGPGDQRGHQEKELVGQYKNAGREWRPAGEPVKVKTHDFLDRRGPGKAIPYGIYDIAADTG